MSSNITAQIQELHESQNWNEIVALYNQNEQEFTNITSSNIDENCLIIELRMIFAKAFYKMKDLEKSYNLFLDGVDHYDLSIDMYPNFSKEHLKLNLSALSILELLSDLTRKYEMWESFNSVVMKQITIYKDTYEMTNENEYSSKFFKYLNKRVKGVFIE
ncbi:MAG: hypothetical protein J0647_00795 [Campylobacteraceae bacterium]|nr:hypothetical protein [Campylobacteraceae bacterium]